MGWSLAVTGLAGDQKLFSWSPLVSHLHSQFP